jgi:hypothetical protein
MKKMDRNIVECDAIVGKAVKGGTPVKAIDPTSANPFRYAPFTP